MYRSLSVLLLVKVPLVSYPLFIYSLEVSTPSSLADCNKFFSAASAPQNFTATATSSSSVLLNWATPVTPNGKILHYQVYYKHNRAKYQVYNSLNNRLKY